MRKVFAQLLLEEMGKNNDIVLITADMGYGLWDKVKETYPNRFYNVGSAEQLMLGVAAGFAMEKKIPVCYSITSFLLYRPFEFIRNFMNHEKLPIKLAGGGRNKDYGYLGFTHWAIDDMDILSNLPNINKWKPENEESLKINGINKFLYDNKPSYINLSK